ncbi:bi-domain-containing oxidoreductase [Sulfurovum mangrovi]|uniref:bi-domain-containing oxidoreductase n=1 Tax=Sulfurovum mangrovi TaxID=2893889 RepID=UPI001E52EA68|nr:bi-domain-containing oxidoreductase [Sulfurovum mangrovi]UFH59211.1 bi-domain-containing oxidoreductase [Sulfurovum mangrovi]
MKQVIQNFKSGELYVGDVPVPSLQDKFVLVENKFSLISAGTERGTVGMGKASLLGKAKKRPDLVKQVLASVKKEGIKATFDKVKTKLDSLAALGYSSAGTVMASLDSNGEFQPGDRVACAGQNYASHSEVVSVPQNLVMKIPDNVSFEEASFTTLGGIAMQGVRQAEVQLGDNICVIGLGLLGQLTCQLLKANGCNVFGIDVSQGMVDLANETNVAKALNRNDTSLTSAIENFTKGHGFDKVIITAAAPTNDPIVLATETLRKKGQIIIVGAVPMDIPREPDFYRKELELKISTSYGPGRYDVSYEEEGHDYPYGYVRWTEKRNMEAFLILISSGAIDVKPLITHIFEIEKAEEAYDIVLGKVKEKFIGILLEYPENETKRNTLIKSNEINKTQKINVGFIGAGSFAQGYLIPACAEKASLDVVVTSTGINAKSVADKFGFNASSTDANDILDNSEINTVFIATRHDTHAKYVIDALHKKKNVFVEKPLAMSYEELEQVKEAYEESGQSLMIGFNRRFAPVTVKLKKEFENIGEPLVMNFRVNAGFIPKDHWTQTEAGGGRIVGEICHFIDLMQFFTGAKPVKVFAECISTNNSQIKSDDNIVIIVKFSDGSVGNLTYVANADKSLAKEHLEIFGGGKAGVIQDFRSGVIYKNNGEEKLKLSGKGQKQGVQEFIRSLNEGTQSLISFESLYLTTLTTFKIQDSLITGQFQAVE